MLPPRRLTCPAAGCTPLATRICSTGEASEALLRAHPASPEQSLKRPHKRPGPGGALSPELHARQVVVCGLDGSCLTAHRAYGNALGVKAVAWAPTGQLLALGSYDQAKPVSRSLVAASLDTCNPA